MKFNAEHYVPSVDVNDRRIIQELSKDRSKASALEEDLYFRESSRDVFDVFGSDAIPALGRLALLMLKPDAVVSRRASDILSFTSEHGFEVRAASHASLTRHSMRELWRHDWPVYPVDRLRFCDMWYQAAGVLILMLEDIRPLPGISASERLTKLKGDSIAHRRSADSLRSRLQPPNQVLNFVHVADEPIDLVRELGILIDRSVRLKLLDECSASSKDAGNNVLTKTAELYAAAPMHDLSLVRSLDRLQAMDYISIQTKSSLAHLAESGTKLPFDVICDRIGVPTDPTAKWDFISVASSLIPLERMPLPQVGWR